ISWSGCYSMGIGLKTGNWPPMGLQTAYPEWIYAFYKFLADQEVSKVQLTSALDQRAQKMGI
ncbi:MAG: hypothetical protein ACREP9_03145, partial [Candidatus Dormibacteraceae bacterium]